MPTATKRTTKTAEAATIEINPINRVSIELTVLGTRPIILNRLSQKAQRELLFPTGGRKTAAQRAQALKHDPIVEYRESPYLIRDDDADTLLGQQASAFKGAMMSAALRLPGATKTEIGALTEVEGDLISIWGVPELFMAIVRSADINKTPDIRTRAIVPRWAAKLVVTFTVPNLNERSVVNLVAASGQIAGVGDWRPEKGRGTYGKFTVVNDDDERFLEVCETGGRAAQAAAMQTPECYNEETEELFSWFEVERVARGRAA